MRTWLRMMMQFPSRRPVLAAVAALVATLLLGQGCGLKHTPHARGQEIAQGARIPLPPGLPPRTLTPHAGDERVRAGLNLEEAIASLPSPAFLSGAEVSPLAEGEPVDSDPPIAGQAAYVAGRQAWREGKAFEAIRQLTAASRYMPHSAQVHRLLGTIHTQNGNRVRGAFHLEKAVSLDQSDVMSLFLLGRHLWQQGQWQDAAVTLDLARRQIDPLVESHETLGPLVEYHLAMALAEGGFDGAAADTLELFMGMARPRQRRSGLDLMLAAIDRQESLVLQMIGDARMRLAQPDRALDVYQRALAVEGADRDELAPRLAYTLLVLGRPQEAIEVGLTQLRESAASDRSLALARYLIGQGAPREAIRQTLGELYEQQDRPSSLAMAMSELLPDREGVAVLEDHLAHRPTDRVVLRRLIEVELGAAPPRTVPLLESFTKLIAAHPQTAASHVELLLASAPSLEGIEAALQDKRFDARRSPAAAFVRGSVLHRLGRTDEAIAALEPAVEHDPPYRPAGVLLARRLLDRQSFDRAAEVLDRIGEPADTEVVSMRIRVLMARGADVQARELLEQWLAKNPEDVALLIEQARLQIEAQRYHEAENTLLRAIDRSAREPDLYALLYKLYEDGRVADSERQRIRLLERMQREIPAQRITRLKLAEHHLQTGRADEALNLFQALVREDPNDWQALGNTLVLLALSGRPDEADAIVQQRLEASPRDRRLLETIRAYYAATRNTEQWMEIGLRLLDLDPPSERRSLDLVSIYRHLERDDDALRVLEEAFSGRLGELKDGQTFAYHLMHLEQRRHDAAGAFNALGEWVKRYPKFEAELMLVQAMAAERMGDQAQAEKLMVDLLSRHPDHAPTNNALGYTWSNRDENLDQALKMITLAVEAEPANPAYLDSMGWVLYKLGRFEEAVKWLQDSRQAARMPQAVIYDHLGDALYRVGRTEEAQLWWQRARVAAEGEDPADDPELEGLDERLTAKLDAVSEGKRPPVAASPVADTTDEPALPVAPTAPTRPGPPPAP